MDELILSQYNLNVVTPVEEIIGIDVFGEISVSSLVLYKFRSLLVIGLNNP